MFITAGISWFITFKRSAYVPNFFASGVLMICIILGVVLFRQIGLVKWHVDSFFYLESSALIAHNHYEQAPIEQYEKRLLVIPVIHAPAAITGDLYLRSATPFISVCLLMLLVFFFKEGSKKFKHKQMLVLLGACGVFFLLTTNRYIWHSFYLNGHLLFATLILIISGSSWLLLSRNRSFAQHGLIGLQAVAAPTLAILRPEGALLALFALLPTICLVNSRKLRVVPLAILGFVTFCWNGYILFLFRQSMWQVSKATFGLCAFGLMMLFGAYAWQRFVAYKSLEKLLWFAEGSLLFGLLALIFNNPAIFHDSNNSLIQNVVFSKGSWGLGLLLIVGLFFLCLVFLKVPNRIALRFPVTTFLPLAYVAAYLRDGVYRVGDGDSLNRMLVQVLPLITLTLVASASGTWRTMPWTSHKYRRSAILQRTK